MIYLANTGYGYGDSEEVAYSEALFTYVADAIGRGDVTIGEAVIRPRPSFVGRLNERDLV